MIEKLIFLSMFLSSSLTFLFCYIIWKKKCNASLYIDNITRLHNLNSIYKEYNSLVQKGLIQKYSFIVLDIENFRSYNTLYDEYVGNNILYSVGNEIKKILDSEEYASRVAGDNFVILLKKESDLIMRLQNLVLSIKYCYKNINSPIELSVGVYKLLEQDTSYIQSNTYALLAKQQAKNNPQKCISFYDETLTERFFEEQILLKDFTEAIRNKEFELFYQVKYDIHKNIPIGAEALVRWRHPIYGLLSPIKFIDLLERKKYITKLDLYVVETACQELQKLLLENPIKLQHFVISVNISGIGFMDNEVMQNIEGIVKKFNIPTTNLEFELTESCFIDEKNKKNVIERINILRKQGFQIAMDDFGSGYSSLSLLKNLTIDTLKLDKGFLDENTNKATEIVDSIINMANKLGISTVAEGIETEEQLSLLMQKGCKIGQGYFYSKPIPFEEFKLTYITNE